MIKYLLDSGDPEEYRLIAKSAKKAGDELWGSTTNPSLVAKKLAGKKLSIEEAFALQKNLVMEILSIVPGAVSAEVYADEKTTAQEMIEQGRDIATWHERIYVKLPTTIEGFKARTILRQEGIAVNNTLVFSQEQIFAICLHERIMHDQYHIIEKDKPSFISPFLGRLDDIGENGLSLLGNGMKLKDKYFDPNSLWMLSASIRTIEHMKGSTDLGSELVTAPAKIYTQWFAMDDSQRNAIKPIVSLQEIPYWEPSEELLQIKTVEEFMKAIETGELNIHHELTDKGIVKFVEDWSKILDVES